MLPASSIIGICIEPGYHDRESVKAAEVATRWGLKVISTKDPDPNLYAPVGGVEFCEDVLGWLPVPDFYPSWLRDWRHREITEEYLHYGQADRSFFAKGAEQYKNFPAVLYNPGDLLPKGAFYVSEPVQFTQEWRYYVADGCVLATGWYDGDDDDEPAPDLDIAWSKGWHGAADFGRLSSGELALVECQHPYACGWYGDDHSAYLLWLILGWEYMLREKP